MKTVILSVWIVAGMIVQGFSQTEPKEIIVPNFLVHNQLSAEPIKIEYTGGLTSGKFKSTDSEVSHIKQSTFTIMGYPVALIRKQQQQLYLGFGYTQNKYTTDSEFTPAFLEQPLHSANVNAFFNTRIKNRLYWFSYVQVGVQGSNPFDNISNTHNEILLNKINYKVKRNLNIGLGLTYVSNLGEPFIVPAVAFVYSGRYYLINIDFPIKTEVEAILAHGRWRPVIGVLFPKTTHHIKNDTRYFGNEGLIGYAGVRYRILDFLYLHGIWQSGLDETFTYGIRSNRKEIGTFSGQNRLLISLNIQVARIIPEE